MLARDRSRWPGFAAPLFALAFVLAGCGDDENPAAPPGPVPPPQGWFTQLPNTPMPLFSVHFVNDTSGVVVGAASTIRRTSDGGRTWLLASTPPAPTTDLLSGVAFGDTSTTRLVRPRAAEGVAQLVSLAGVAVGTEGTALYTFDGGLRWRQPLSPARTELFGVTFPTATTAIAVGAGSRIYQSTDGGGTWTLRFSGNSARNLVAVSFGDADHGTAVGFSGQVFHTADGGTTWEQQIPGTTTFLRDVWFSDANTGTAVGDGGTILRTTDGGVHWDAQRSGVIAALTGVWFADADTGTVVGFAGTILRTTDGGRTWVKQDSGTVQDLYDVSFSDTHTGTAVGANGTVLRTVTGGEK